MRRSGQWRSLRSMCVGVGVRERTSREHGRVASTDMHTGVCVCGRAWECVRERERKRGACVRAAFLAIHTRAFRDTREWKTTS
jgi:hypothetical protein